MLLLYRNLEFIQITARVAELVGPTMGYLVAFLSPLRFRGARNGVYCLRMSAVLRLA
jgi:hypothetical protein